MLRFPVVSEGAEYLVIGHLMRRNIMTFKAPPQNEGYDLVCIHPDSHHRVRKGQKAHVRIQVKSRYQTDCDKGFPIKESSLEAFDFLVIAFLNIGEFFRGRDGSRGSTAPEFYTLTRKIIRKLHDTSSSWQKVRLGGQERMLSRYKDDLGFELIAKELGVPRPTR